MEDVLRDRAITDASFQETEKLSMRADEDCRRIRSDCLVSGMMIVRHDAIETDRMFSVHASDDERLANIGLRSIPNG